MNDKESEKVKQIIKEIQAGLDMEDVVARHFPNLIRELTKEDHEELQIDAIRQDPKLAENKADELRNPDTISFIRRCETVEQAREVIEFQLKRGKITEAQAARFLVQLDSEGLRSFGPKKEPGYYEKHFPRC
ncbi:MAG: DUF2095 family protein [Candidatus Helarchaeota archaeon]